MSQPMKQPETKPQGVNDKSDIKVENNPHKKENLLLHCTHKVNLKWSIGLNVKENTGV